MQGPPGWVGRVLLFVDRPWKIAAGVVLALTAIVGLVGCKGLEGGAAAGGCLVGEASAANTSGTLTTPRGPMAFTVSAPAGTNLSLCAW
jgi:hypothetical protein